MNRQPGETLGFTHGVFDVLHPGHVSMLEEAAGHCDRLVVGVQTDPSIDRPGSKARTIQSLEERLVMVKAIRWVDSVVTYETEGDLLALLQELQPDVRIIDPGLQGREYTGHDLPIRIVFSSRDHSHPSSSLRARIYEAEKSRLYVADRQALEDWKRSSDINRRR